jgi:hypothetical protein
MHVDFRPRGCIITKSNRDRLSSPYRERIADACGNGYAVADALLDAIVVAVAESERRSDERTLGIIHAVLGGDFERIRIAQAAVADADRKRRANVDATTPRADDPADAEPHAGTCYACTYTERERVADLAARRNADLERFGYRIAGARTDAYDRGYVNGKRDAEREAEHGADIARSATDDRAEHRSEPPAGYP